MVPEIATVEALGKEALCVNSMCLPMGVWTNCAKPPTDTLCSVFIAPPTCFIANDAVETAVVWPDDNVATGMAKNKNKI